MMISNKTFLLDQLASNVVYYSDGKVRCKKRELVTLSSFNTENMDEKEMLLLTVCEKILLLL